MQNMWVLIRFSVLFSASTVAFYVLKSRKDEN